MKDFDISEISGNWNLYEPISTIFYNIYMCAALSSELQWRDKTGEYMFSAMMVSQALNIVFNVYVGAKVDFEQMKLSFTLSRDEKLYFCEVHSLKVVPRD